MEAIVKHLIHRTAALGLVLLFGLTACADLDVINPDAADTERALGTPGDIESLVGSSFNQWWQSAHEFDSGSPILGNQSFMMSSWPANFGMFFYSRLPGVAIENDPTHEFYTQMVSFAWNRNYRALSMVASGLNSLDEPEIAEALGAERVHRARTFGRFMQGMAHASLAVRYDEGWIIDETVQLTDEEGFALVLETVPYEQVLVAALGYFDEAIAMAGAATWSSIPSSWVPSSVTLTPALLAQIAHSMKARFRANVARTPEERGNVDWAAVVADVDAGVTTDWSMRYSWFGSPFQSQMVGQFSNPSIGWNQMSYMMYGMADQSGMYQDWLSFPVGDRHPNFPDDTPRLIHTPDQRFPQGETLAEQRANPGMPHSLTGSPHIIIFGSDVDADPSWGQPARGSHRWSWYRDAKTAFHRSAGDTPTDVPEITMAEMRLLRAEAAFNGGPVSLAEAAAAINVTREAAGLAPTDAGGTNADCVPRLPDGSCGNLFEMLKWEKRNETAWFGMNANTWWFDGRGWGDLYRGTALQIPVPCLDRELMDPAAPSCDTYGGSGPMSSPGSSYNFPHEG
jgi:hypothetical protein